MAKMSYDEFLIDDALDKYKRALKLIQLEYGEKHYLTADPMTKLAKTYLLNDDYYNALTLLFEALDNKTVILFYNYYYTFKF